MSQTNLTSRSTFDSHGSELPRRTTRTDPTGAAKIVAKQPDAVFVSMMPKQIHDALPQDGPLGSSLSKIYTSISDQQLSQTMASRGVGVVDQLLKQMLRRVNRANPDTGGEVNTTLSNMTAINTTLPGAAGATNDAVKATIRSSLSNIAAAITPDIEDDDSDISTVPRPDLEERVQRALAALRKQTDAQVQSPGASPGVDLSMVASEPRGKRMNSFCNKLTDHASQAAQETDIPTNPMVGYAALESGWGRRETEAKDDMSTRNLFGIKTGGSWAGETAIVTTTEYISGVTHKVQRKFRVYSSYVEAFKGYANLLVNDPHCSNVVAAGNDDDATSSVKGSQYAGCTTGPNYAHKIMTVLKQTA